MTESIEPKHFFTVDGVTSHIFHADTGQGLPKHQHVYPHATYVCSGSIKVIKENQEYKFDKFDKPVMLRAHEWHEIQALEDNTVFVNVFAADTR